jgi:hypothetical protein
VQKCLYRSINEELLLKENSVTYLDIASTPDEVTDFFNAPNTSNRTIAPEFTQPLTEVSTRIFLGVSAAGV